MFGIGEGVGYIKCSWFDGEGYFYCVKAVLLISWFRVMYFDYFENVHHLFFGSSQNGTLTMLTASEFSFDCVQIFSLDIAVSKKLPCLNLPTLNVLYRYTPDIYIYCKSLDYRLCVWYYVIPVCCESVSIVLKLYFNLFFHINSISNESLIIGIMVFGFHEKNDPFVKELVTVFNSTVLILLIPRALTFTSLEMFCFQIIRMLMWIMCYLILLRA